MSEVAAEGLELTPDPAWLVARSPAEFADRIARCMRTKHSTANYPRPALAIIRYGAGAVIDSLRLVTVVPLAGPGPAA